jgi:hypothetical protein
LGEYLVRLVHNAPNPEGVFTTARVIRDLWVLRQCVEHFKGNNGQSPLQATNDGGGQ